MSKPISHFILKIASRCNLNCTYCYVYNKGDASWQEKPPLMTIDVFRKCIERIARHIASSGQAKVRISFHGGEPCLIGADRFGDFCSIIRHMLPGLDVQLTLQTNATLLNADWIKVLLVHQVDVGISIDGPSVIHDAARVDRKGRGSYANVIRGLTYLQNSDVPHIVLCVIPIGADALAVYRNFQSIGCNRILFIFPDHTHETVKVLRQVYGPTPCADFLIPIFDDWWDNSTLSSRIADLENIARMILGGSSRIETFGNLPPGYVVVESDGQYEGIDCLRICGEGFTKTPLNVFTSDFEEFINYEGFHSRSLFSGLPIPTACDTCEERETCAGGYVPHRFSLSTGFDNPSVWCSDILKLFQHIRNKMDVTPSQSAALRETYKRRIPIQKTNGGSNVPADCVIVPSDV